MMGIGRMTSPRSLNGCLQSRINKFRSLVKHGHIPEKKELITIQNWLEDAKSAQEKVRECMAGLAPKEGADNMIEEKKMYRVIASMIRSLTRVAEKEIKLEESRRESIENCQYGDLRPIGHRVERIKPVHGTHIKGIFTQIDESRLYTG